MDGVGDTKKERNGLSQILYRYLKIRLRLGCDNEMIKK